MGSIIYQPPSLQAIWLLDSDFVTVTPAVPANIHPNIGVVELHDGESLMERFVVDTTDVLKVGFNSDGNRIVATTVDGSSLIFEFSPLQELINNTRDRFKNRLLTIEERERYYLE